MPVSLLIKQNKTSNVKQTQIVSNEILTNNIKLQEEIPTQNNNISATTENNTNTRIFGVTNPVTMNTEITENRKEEEETKDINTNDIKACAKLGKKGADAYFAAHNDIKAITETFTELGEGNFAFSNRARQKYKSADTSLQEKILLATGFKGVELLGESKNKTLKDMLVQYTNNALVQATENEIEIREKNNPDFNLRNLHSLRRNDGKGNRKSRNPRDLADRAQRRI